MARLLDGGAVFTDAYFLDAATVIASNVKCRQAPA
jgi:hypothetical protein